MKLTTKGRYAVTAMLDLAMHQHEKPITLADVARRQNLSLAYLEQLFGKLRTAGLVTSTRGPGGGYCLSRPPEQLSVADIVIAVDEEVDATACNGKANCDEDEQCLTHDLWMDLSGQIRQYLATISLASLMQRDAVQLVAKRQDRLLIQA